MLIVHENMPEEAANVAQAVKSTYGIDSVIELIGLEETFTPIPKFKGYWHSSIRVAGALREFTTESGKETGKAILLLTHRDLYLGDDNQEDNWIFGYNTGNISVVSGARMKREDNVPSDELHVSRDLYLSRLKVLGVHEIGHDVINRERMQIATWVNAKTGYELNLGPHCTDNTCVMYEVVDIKAPPQTDGYMRLGTEKRFDASLDDLIRRLRPDYLCTDCRDSVKIGASYE